MKIMKTLGIVLALTLSSHLLLAQLTIGTQIRPRAEFRNGMKTLTLDDRDAAFFMEQRSRFFVDYNDEKFRVKFNLQDVRIWGSTDQIYKTDPTLTSMYEAWALYRLNTNWSFKLGRMPLDYDNARFLGNLDWAAQGRSHDVVLFSYRQDSSSTLKIDVGGAFNQTGFEPGKLAETFYSGVNNYKTMQFLWANKKFDNAKVSFLFHNDGRQVLADSSVNFRQTYGLKGTGEIAGLNVGGEFYYQGGKNAVDKDINAFMASAFVTLKTDLTPITIGADYLTGTSLKDTDDKSFNPLYGTNHKFYGYMDYFYVGSAHGQAGTPAGLLDVHLKTKFKSGDKSVLVANAHMFSSAADLYEPTNLGVSKSKYLGTEIDLVYVLKIDKDIKLNLGYSQMFAGESMELVKAIPGDHEALNNWVWFMIDFNPVVFTKN